MIKRDIFDMGRIIIRRIVVHCERISAAFASKSKLSDRFLRRQAELLPALFSRNFSGYDKKNRMRKGMVSSWLYQRSFIAPVL